MIDTKARRLKPLECGRQLVKVAEEKQASDILLLDIRKVCTFADYFVIMTAGNWRQMKAVADDMEGELKRAGASLHHREGGAESGWLLLDFGDVVVHLFGPEEREYYQLEAMWSKGRQVVRIQ